MMGTMDSIGKKPMDKADIGINGLFDLLEDKVVGRISPYMDDEDFMFNGVWTKDEASGQVKKFGYEEYLSYIIRRRRNTQIFAVEKSRRMRISWLFCGLYLYDALSRKNHNNFVASRKLGSSAELLGRMRFIYEHIPREDWVVPEIKCRVDSEGKGFIRIDVPDNNSSIEAVAEGRDQLRQYTATNILLDEFAFWNDAEGSWAALKPTIEGGGHIDIVSTANRGSFMYRLLYEGDVPTDIYGVTESNDVEA